MLTEPNRTAYFATGNRNKYLEAARIAASFQVNLKYLNWEKLEIQSQSLAEIASFAAKQAAQSCRKVVVVEDAGFFVQALGGFPGPYSSYVFDTVGLTGIMRLARGAKNREASFQAAVAYCEPNQLPICFTGQVAGSLPLRPRGLHGFGYDPIFVPKEGDGRTFAQMSMNEKNLSSHRAKAFTKFCKWFSSDRQQVSSETS
jgi:XTP/dITP diphosphohydrolase